MVVFACKRKLIKIRLTDGLKIVTLVVNLELKVVDVSAEQRVVQGRPQELTYFTLFRIATLCHSTQESTKVRVVGADQWMRMLGGPRVLTYVGYFGSAMLSINIEKSSRNYKRK